MSIRRRLLAILTVAMLTLWASTGIKTYFDAQEQVQELFDAQLEQSAQVVMSLSLHELYEQLAYQAGESIAEQITPFVHKYGQQVAFQVWTGERLAIHSMSSPTRPLAGKYNTFSDTVLDGKQWRVYAIMDESGISVHVGELSERRNQLSAGIALRALAYLAFTLPILAGVIWFGVGNALAPLSKVALAVNSRELDNLEPINIAPIPIEAKPLVMALNDLFGRLRLAVNDIRSFTSDAAHELRTPLAAVRTHVQLAIKAPTQEKSKMALQQVLKAVDRATRLIEQLLTMARLDPENYVEKADHSNLKRLAEGVIAELAPQALRKNIELSLEATYDGEVYGKAHMLEILVANLVENAIKYTPENGKVAVEIFQSGEGVCFDVHDSGPGIPMEDYGNVFKRFFRRKGESQSGTGLGLSIVKRIAEIHRAKVALERSRFNGLKVDVLFPVAA